MNPAVRCPGCGCDAPGGAAAHAVVAALLAGDLDQAFDAGLLDCDRCAGCSDACAAALLTARNARLGALAARERHRARDARLQRRAADVTARRAPAPAIDASATTASRPPLPAGAAAVLARAQAKATGRDRP